MIVERLPSLLLLALASLIVAMGLWYLAVHFRKRWLKRWSITAGLLPLIVVAVSFAQDWLNRQFLPPYRTSTPGPPGRRGSSLREISFQANKYSTYDVTLTPRASPEEPPSKPVSLPFSIQSSTGGVLFMDTPRLSPDRDLQWKPAKVRIEAERSGTYVIKTDIPGPIDILDVEVVQIPE